MGGIEEALRAKALKMHALCTREFSTKRVYLHESTTLTWRWNQKGGTCTKLRSGWRGKWVHCSQTISISECAHHPIPSRPLVPAELGTNNIVNLDGADIAAKTTRKEAALIYEKNKKEGKKIEKSTNASEEYATKSLADFHNRTWLLSSAFSGFLLVSRATARSTTKRSTIEGLVDYWSLWTTHFLSFTSVPPLSSDRRSGRYALLRCRAATSSLIYPFSLRFRSLRRCCKFNFL